MTMLLWARATREQLREAAPRAVAVLPVGAVEQHGPHLPTGTDAAVAEAVARAACERTGAGVVTLLAPTLAFGSSDHHLPFGGTLSLSPATLSAVLADLLRSLRAGGCERALIVNAHGGNAEICGAAAKSAAVACDMLVGAVSYWNVSEAPGELGGLPFPGHAGAFETSLMLALAEGEVERGALAPSPGWAGCGAGEVRGALASAPEPPVGAVVDDPREWERIGGWTDDPRAATAASGTRAIERAGRGVAAVIDALARRER